MKQSDIQPCMKCKRGVCAANPMTFYRVSVEQMFINPGAVQRQSGLEMMLGGNAAIAAVMGMDEDIAASIGKTEGLLCLDCIMRVTAAEILEDLGPDEQREEQDNA